MFWETKWAELQKLAPVELAQPEGSEMWAATMRVSINAPFHKDSGVTGLGSTRAAAMCELWNCLVKGNEPFSIFTKNTTKKIRWNARWEVLEEHTINEPAELVVEEEDPDDFDEAD